MDTLQIRHYKQDGTAVPADIRQATEDRVNVAYASQIAAMNAADVYVCAYYDNADQLTHINPLNCPGSLWPQVSKIATDLNKPDSN